MAKPQRVRVAFQKKTKKAVREETEAEQGFLQAGMGANGVYDHVSLVATLRGLLHKHDPEYRLVSERATMLTRLSEGLRRQDSTATGLGVKRAVFDQLAAGVVAGEYSKRALGRQLHVSRKRTISASMAPSTTLSVKKRKGVYKNKLLVTVEVAVREFVYAHSKFDEKNAICALTKTLLFELFCRFHDKAGNFFPEGNDRALIFKTHPAHSITQVVRCICSGTCAGRSIC